jgi:FAD/FMN-containing dehydrogenase
VSEGLAHYDGFFYPLDIVDGWSKVYGKRGFFQYQMLIPETAVSALITMFELVAKCKMASFLSVLKKCGDIPSQGMMSFPRKGFTLAMDFANHGEETFKLFRRLDEIVLANGGRLYPAKDSAMSAETFLACYPQVVEFEKYVDPLFSSSFWRRVRGGNAK